MIGLAKEIVIVDIKWTAIVDVVIEPLVVASLEQQSTPIVIESQLC